MLYRALADGLVVVHFAFVLFVVLGGLAVLWRSWMAWVHLPCASYGLAIEIFEWTCPLTPLESQLRTRGGEPGYDGGFIDHYVGGLLYPGGLDRLRLWFAAAVVIGNIVIYALVIHRTRAAATATADPLDAA